MNGNVIYLSLVPRTANMFLISICRLVNNMYYVQKDKNFHDIEQRQMHNVMQDPAKNKFWLFDNEYSVYAGYKSLYSRKERLEKTLYFWIHEQIVKTSCLFTENVVNNIQTLANMSSSYEYLLGYIKTKEPLYHKLEASAQLSHLEDILFRTRFHERLNSFMMIVYSCAEL